MTAVIEQALDRWGLVGATYTLAAARENAVYQITTPTGLMALRLHRVGYRTDEELASELDWMAEVSRHGVSVPEPVPTADGALLVHIDGVQIDMLSWLAGQTLDACFDTLSPAKRIDVFAELGRAMADLHNTSDGWTPHEQFTRAAWDIDGLLGEAPLWDRFWDNPHLTAAERDLTLSFRDAARDTLARLALDLDYGLIHADLVPGNVMLDADSLHLIDFDDGGYGFRLFELATALLKLEGASDFTDLRSALITGYHTRRPLDVTQLDLFLAIRAATYVGWNISRMDEQGGAARNERFIQKLVQHAQTYLEQRN